EEPRARRVQGHPARHVRRGPRGGGRGPLRRPRAAREADHDELSVQVRAGEGRRKARGLAVAELGRLAVCLALVCAVFAVGAAITGARRRRRDIVRTAEHAAYAVFVLVALAAAVLLRALLSHDFTLQYVAAYSSSTLPTP